MYGNGDGEGKMKKKKKKDSNFVMKQTDKMIEIYIYPLSIPIFFTEGGPGGR